MTQTTAQDIAQNSIVELGNVRYNAETRCFEALATVRSAGSTAKYPCAIQGPITMSFERAAKGLSVQALRHHQNKNPRGLYSRTRAHSTPPRAGRGRFDPRAWLIGLGLAPSQQVA